MLFTSVTTPIKLRDRRSAWRETATRARNRAFDQLVLSGLLCMGLTVSYFVTPVSAQVSGGSITGNVTDPSGAAVPGAKVKITNRATNISETLTTSETGLFSVPNIDPATYEVVVDQRGFAPKKVETIVTVGRDTVLNIQLPIGTQSETVQVESMAPVVDLGNTALNQTVDGKTLRELPLNGRDYTSLAILEPNVHTVDNQLSIASGDNTRSNRGIGTQISVGGTRPQQNNYRLDGITTNDYSGSGPGGALGGTLGVDAVQEFSVVTSNATADYGRESGGVVSAVTRAGGNKFHGSAYEFIRNSALDAKNYFSNNSAPFKRNQFGATIGGPIIKNKAFFFFNYEGLRQSRSTATSDTVPSAAARTGALVAGHVTVDPKVIPFLALYPLPNGAVTGDTGIWTFDSTAVASENLYIGRADYTFSAKDTIHATAQNDSSTDRQPDGFNFVQTGLDIDRKLYSVGENHIFSSNVVNLARIGYAYTYSIAPASSEALNPQANNPALGFVPGQNVGELQISGLSTFFGGVNAEGIYAFHYHSYQVGDDLFWTRGTHSLQLGGSYERIQSNDIGSVTNGFYTFNSLATFLTNKPTQFTSNIPGSGIPIYLRQNVFGAYAMDSWHLRKTLTLTFGLRYEPASVITEKYNHLATLSTPSAPNLQLGSPFFQNPTFLNFASRVGVAWDPFGRGTTSVRAAYGIYDTLPLTYMFTLNTVTVAPYGSSASITNSTLINGKPVSLAGTFPNQTYPLAIQAATNKVAYVEQNPRRSYVQQYLLNIQQQLSTGTSLELGYTGAHGVRQPLKANDANIVEPTNPNDIKNLVWPTLNCTTSKGSTSCVSTGKKINPAYGSVDTTLWDESTLYDAFNASLRRASRNSRLGISYTLAKSIDESSSSNAGTNFTNSLISPYPVVIDRFRGLSDFNVQHNLVVNGLYTVTGPKDVAFLHAALDGLQAGGVVRFATGLPFTPLITGDQLGLSNNNPFSFPDRIYGGNCSGNPVNLADKANYLRRECFAFPGTVPTTPTGTYTPRLGNTARNSIIGPGITTVDISMVKNTAIPKVSESFRAEFRAEAFNVLNHPNFQVPSRTASAVFNATGGPLAPQVLTATSTSERQIQFGLKLIF